MFLEKLCFLKLDPALGLFLSVLRSDDYFLCWCHSGSQLDSAIFAIRLTSLNYCKLFVKCTPSGIRYTGRTLVWSWCVSGMLLRSATACVGGSSRVLALSICVTRLLPFIVWLGVKVTQDWLYQLSLWTWPRFKMYVLKEKQPDSRFRPFNHSVSASEFRPDDSTVAGWLAGVPSCNASAPCFVHGSSDWVSRKVPISGTSFRSPFGINKCLNCVSSLSVRGVC